jgi:hypothetical protein
MTAAPLRQLLDYDRMLLMALIPPAEIFRFFPSSSFSFAFALKRRNLVLIGCFSLWTTQEHTTQRDEKHKRMSAVLDTLRDIFAPRSSRSQSVTQVCSDASVPNSSKCLIGKERSDLCVCVVMLSLTLSPTRTTIRRDFDFRPRATSSQAMGNQRWLHEMELASIVIH